MLSQNLFKLSATVFIISVKSSVRDYLNMNYNNSFQMISCYNTHMFSLIYLQNYCCSGQTSVFKYLKLTSVFYSSIVLKLYSICLKKCWQETNLFTTQQSLLSGTYLKCMYSRMTPQLSLARSSMLSLRKWDMYFTPEVLGIRTDNSKFCWFLITKQQSELVARTYRHGSR